jgi:hypothetical protein
MKLDVAHKIELIWCSGYAGVQATVVAILVQCLRL